MKAVPPFVRMLAPLVAGVLIYSELYDKLWITTQSLSFLLPLSILVAIIGLWLSGKNSIIRPLLVMGLLFSLGILVANIQKQQFEKEVVQVASEEYDAFLIKVSSLGEKRKKSIRYEGTVISLHATTDWRKVNSRILFSISTSDTTVLSPGSIILGKGQLLKRPKKPLNPEEFDYSLYLERKGIAWTAFLPEGTYKINPAKESLSVFSLPLYIVKEVETIFARYLTNPKTFGLVKSMLLGRRDDLGPDLLNSYVVSGTVHVLAVSGLHVGILFVMLAKLLGGLKRRRWGAVLYGSVVVAVLVTYAFITGLSPSVIRATLMCIIWVVAELTNRKHNSVNTLAISAFLILLIDPFAIYSVGFQLSYAAVLGIILFYPLFKDVYSGKNRVLQWLWQVSLVGFAAQLATFPISIYYFHQFPTYFWLVNPFVIFLTSGLIYSALGLLLVSLLPFAFLTELLAVVVDSVAYLTNSIVEVPQKLPNFLIQSLYLDRFEVVVLLVLLLMFSQTLARKEYTFFKRFAGGVLLFCGYSVGTSVAASLNPQLLLHAVARHTVVTYVDGNQALVFCNNSFRYDTISFDYSIKNYLISRGVKDVQFVELKENRLNRPELLIIKNKIVGFDVSLVDNKAPWVMVRGKKFPKIEDIQIQKGQVYVLSPELGYKTREEWKNIVTQQNGKYYSPAESGALVLH